MTNEENVLLVAVVILLILNIALNYWFLAILMVVAIWMNLDRRRR